MNAYITNKLPVKKPVYFPFNCATFYNKMHQWVEQQCRVCALG